MPSIRNAPSMLSLAVVALSLGAWASAASAQSTPTSAAASGAKGAAVASTVEELMVLDANQALQRARAKEREQSAAPGVPAQASTAAAAMAALAAAPAAAAPRPPATGDLIEVLSIAGWGDRIRASVSINGVAHHHLGVGSRAGNYSVLSVGSGCVRLRAAVPASARQGDRSTPRRVTGAKAGAGSQGAAPAERQACFQDLEPAAPRTAAGMVAAGPSGAPMAIPVPLPAPMPTLVLPTTAAPGR